jgi:carbon storage regulator CsrA
MLVLSRGRNDKVVFPTLGISVEILRVAGNKVRLGIEAPKEVPVHRHEVAHKIAEFEGEAELAPPPSIRLSHPIRNRLHTAALGLHVLHRRLEKGEVDDAEATIFGIFNELRAIEEELRDDERPTKPAGLEMGHGRRALIVEDNDNERELLASYLRMSGFEVDTAIDGLQAMVKLSKQPSPHVVLLDMKMPRFDGSKTVTAIRDNPDYRGLKVFAVTGADQSQANVAIGPNGVDRWMSKPLDPEALLEAIEQELQPHFLSA